MACQHEFKRYGETKPFPGRKQHVYVRNVSECVKCGHRSASGWARALKSSLKKGDQ